MERRIRIVGLCLIAVFALSAMVAVTSASATVEIGECVKTIKGAKGFKGHFTGKKCHPGVPPAPEGEEATPEEQGLGGKHNKYDWSPGGGPNPTYTAKGKEVTISTGLLEIKCKNSVDSTGDSLRGSNTLEARFNFKTCIQPKSPGGKQPCKTHGKNEGEIETKELVGTLSENGAKEAMISYAAKTHGVEFDPNETWAEFECKETTYTLNGTLTGKDNQAVQHSGQESRDRVHGRRSRTGTGGALPERVHLGTGRRTDRSVLLAVEQVRSELRAP